MFEFFEIFAFIMSLFDHHNHYHDDYVLRKKKEKKNHWKRNMMKKVTLQGVMMKKMINLILCFAKFFSLSKNGSQR